MAYFYVRSLLILGCPESSFPRPCLSLPTLTIDYGNANDSYRRQKLEEKHQLFGIQQ